ncbi:MAG: hypothetical protein EXR72_27370 [Myxococcales bacterium]|nr:hypothetical protein [Myxococcales bacterium]
MPSRLFLVAALLLVACGGGTQSTVECLGSTQKFGSVCLTKPTVDAVRTKCGDVTEFCDKAGAPKPNLACLTAAPKMRPATPDKVTLTGFVHPFSSGTSNSTVTIQVFKAADLIGGADPDQAPQVVPATTVDFVPGAAKDFAKFRACDTDPQIGCVPIAPAACKAPACSDGLEGRSDDKKYCHLVNNTPACDPRLRWEPRFAIAGLPTNTPLVIRTSGKEAKADPTWAVLVTWNVYLASDDRSCSGDPQATDCLDTSDMAAPKYQLNVNVLSQADYGNIPNVAGLSGGISRGLGAVAGEVHDCDNFRLGNIQVGVKPAGDRFTYFNGNPYNTLPDSGRASSGTDRLGLYAALNVKPGKVEVEGAGLVDGQMVSVGKFSAVLYPDSVAVLNINGGKPSQ